MYWSINPAVTDVVLVPTTEHILSPRRLIQRVKERNMKAILLSSDFKKVFDSLHRRNMKATLVFSDFKKVFDSVHREKWKQY